MKARCAAPVRSCGPPFAGEIHTTSVYLQDRWALSRQVSFDVGARDERVRNDSTGDIVSAKTDTWLPRLAATYDVAGDGRWMAQATYGHYAGRYSEAQFTANSHVGNPSLLISVYTGPAGEGLGFAPGMNPATTPCLCSAVSRRPTCPSKTGCRRRLPRR